jgi:hypothetical protein
MHKLLIALMLVSGIAPVVALADPPRYQTYQDQMGRTVAGSSCSGGYCAQYDSTGRTVGTSAYTQDRAPQHISQQTPQLIPQQTPLFNQLHSMPRGSPTGEGLFLFAN